MSRHVKGADSLEEVKKVLVYYLERLEREERNRKISWVFDCKNAGLKNMELELVNFIIFCMEQNYPDILNFIYIYEMPWIMNAAFKVNLKMHNSCIFEITNDKRKDGKNEMKKCCVKRNFFAYLTSMFQTIRRKKNGKWKISRLVKD